MSKNSIANQSRWNSYGRAWAKQIKSHPQKFVISKCTSFEHLPQFEKIFRSAFKNLKNKNILEIGCGKGELSVYLAKEKARVTATDVGAGLVEAGKMLAKANDVKLRFCVTSATKLPFYENSFDYGIGTCVLHHLSEKDLKRAVGEMLRVLKPGGQFIALEPIEESVVFDFIQNLIPITNKSTGTLRPSILQSKKWQKFLSKVDERNLSLKEIRNAFSVFREVKMEHIGLIGRLDRIFPSMRKHFDKFDVFVIRSLPFLKKFSRNVVIIAKK